MNDALPPATAGDALFSFTPDVDFAGNRAQRIEFRAADAGVEQSFWAPLHRTRRYRWMADLRACGGRADLRLELAPGAADGPDAQRSVPLGVLIPGGEWSRFDGEFIRRDFRRPHPPPARPVPCPGRVRPQTIQAVRRNKRH